MDATPPSLLAHRWMPQLLEIARFGVVGVGATVVQFASASALTWQFPLWPLQGVNLLAFLIAFCFSFTGQFFWTFRASGASLRRSLPKFFLVALCGYLVSAFVLNRLQHAMIGNDHFKLLVSTLVIPPVTFTIGKFWAFAA